eukprot:15340106-Ditylum_brightwellii.AAC.1
MLMTINAIAAQHANPTINIAKDMVHLLHYCSTHPNEVLRYSASGMILHIHSDALHLSETEAHSQSGGHFFLSSALEDPNKTPTAPVPLNGPIHTVCKFLCTVMVSATEAEIGALYINTHKGGKLCLALKEIGYPLLPTLVMTDNSTICGMLNKTVKQKRTWAIDTQFYWVRNRIVKDPRWRTDSRAHNPEGRPMTLPFGFKVYMLSLPYDEHDDDLVLTVDKMKRLYQEAKGKMNQALLRWKKSKSGIGNMKQISGIQYKNKSNDGIDVELVDND